MVNFPFVVAGAAFGTLLVPFFVAGVTFGEPLFPFFVAGAASGQSQLSCFVAGAKNLKLQVAKRVAKRLIVTLQSVGIQRYARFTWQAWGRSRNRNVGRVLKIDHVIFLTASNVSIFTVL